MSEFIYKYDDLYGPTLHSNCWRSTATSQNMRSGTLISSKDASMPSSSDYRQRYPVRMGAHV